MSDSIKSKLIRLERILDATTEGWWEWNTETNQTLHGAGWFKMLGMDPKDGLVSNAFWEEQIHPDDRERTISNQLRFILSDEPWEQEYRMLHVNGNYVWILSRGKVLYRSADGEALQVGGLNINISHQKEIHVLKDELKNKENLVQSILKVSLSGISMYDFMAQHLNFSSGNIMREMGYVESEFMSVSKNFFKDVLHPEDQPKMQDHINKLIQSRHGQVLECLLRFRSKKGEYHTIMLRDSVFARDEQGQPQEVICSAMDISKYLLLKRKMDENMQFIHELSFKNSHEMRAPVASMLGLLRLIKVELYSPAAVEELINYLDQMVTKMDEVIRDLTNTLESKMKRD